ncbi:MAG: aspartate aminotransferase family protein [Candidatus Geothermarchaeales archaeon]
MATAPEISEKDKYFLPVVYRWFKEEPLVAVRGRGALLIDSKGREYIDLLAGHAANYVGHCHPKVVEAIKSQAEKLVFTTTDFHTVPAAMLAEKIAGITPPYMNKAYFTSAGAEAVEVALYLSRKATKRYEFICLYGAFHGRTYGARSAVGWHAYKKSFGPMVPGFTHIPWYYCYRCIFKLQFPDCDLLCAKVIEDVLKFQTCGDVAAFLAESMLGAAGHIPAPPGYFEEVKKILDENEILFIADEVMSGGGRTGKIWCIEHYDVKPDMITFGKFIGGGMPLSGVVASDEVAEAYGILDYFTTFGCNPVAAAAGNAVVDIILEEKLADRSAELGKYFMKGLNDLREGHKLIGDVRGKGLFIGVELVRDRETKEPAVEESTKFRELAREGGVIVAAGWGWYKNTMRIHPPAVITREQIDKVLEVFDDSLKEVERGL